jgi:hypothetical protein
MRYSLRTLLIVMLLGGPALAALWWAWNQGSAAFIPMSLVAADALIKLTSN